MKGETIIIERTTFNLDWEKLSINVVNSNIKIQGLQRELVIYNSNLKNKNIPNFSYLEIIIYFIFIFTILSLFSLFLYKIYNL